MSNTYFRFKEFTIHQDRCAMKVSTDACIAGAWTELPIGTKRVLDIGTGTGLLALMLAQKNPDIIIDAIELDAEAAAQASGNVAISPWADKVNIIHADASQYTYPYRYDFIIINPPFFNNSLLSNKEQRNMARHTLSLSYQSLFDIISSCLNDTGMVSVLLPYAEHNQWEILLQDNNWCVVKKLQIHPRVGNPANRVVSIWSRNSSLLYTEENLYIRGRHDDYTDAFSQLMYPYYLDK